MTLNKVILDSNLDIMQLTSVRSLAYPHTDRLPSTAGGFSFEKQSKVHCGSNSYPTLYGSLARAQIACLSMGSSCAGVYDDGCDGNGFYLCRPGRFSSSSMSCVFALSAPNAAPILIKNGPLFACLGGYFCRGPIGWEQCSRYIFGSFIHSGLVTWLFVPTVGWPDDVAIGHQILFYDRTVLNFVRFGTVCSSV